MRPALTLKGEELWDQNVIQHDDNPEATGDPTADTRDVDGVNTWPVASPTPTLTRDPPNITAPTQAGSLGNQTRECHGARTRCGLGLCHQMSPPWRVPSAPHPLLLAASPHLWSLPIGNGSGVPVKYWSPVIFVLLALLVLFFTYRRTKGEGELLAGAPVVGAAPRWVQQQRVVANPASLKAPRKAAKCHPCWHGSMRVRAG